MFQQQGSIPFGMLHPPLFPCFPPLPAFEDNDIFISVGPPGPPGPPGPQGPVGPPGTLADLPVTLVEDAVYNPSLSEYFLGVITDEPCTIILPAGTLGKAFIIKDSIGDCSTNNITVQANTIDGQVNYVLNIDWSSIALVYNGIEWNIV